MRQSKLEKRFTANFSSGLSANDRRSHLGSVGDEDIDDSLRAPTQRNKTPIPARDKPPSMRKASMRGARPRAGSWRSPAGAEKDAFTAREKPPRRPEVVEDAVGQADSPRVFLALCRPKVQQQPSQFLESHPLPPPAAWMTSQAQTRENTERVQRIRRLPNDVYEEASTKRRARKAKVAREVREVLHSDDGRQLRPFSSNANEFCPRRSTRVRI